MPTTSDFEGMLRGAALRVTRPRVAVLSAVHDHSHADMDSIIGVVREDLGEVSHQAVYDVLSTLTAAGLVRRIEPAGSVARYEARVGDNHHPRRTRSCGLIADVDCAVGEAPCLTASDDSGFSIDEAEVIYWGRPMSGVCRGDVGRVRRLIADPPRQTPRSDPPSNQSHRTSSATSQRKETARQGKDRHV